MSTSSAGTVRWQQISEDLVPVNISCIQDQPDYVFHITAYNSQVDKILDVRLTQPGNHSIIVCCLFCCCIHFDEEEIPQHSSSSHLIKDLEDVCVCVSARDNGVIMSLSLSLLDAEITNWHHYRD